METGYQRGRIQDESMLYEQRKHDGTLPIIGVNTFRRPTRDHAEQPAPVELARGTENEKRSQIQRLHDFHTRHRDEAELTLRDLRSQALANRNLFAVLMNAARVCSLGQITDAFFDLGGRYRRNV
jgi:methylmalonyl-CoA mutase